MAIILNPIPFLSEPVPQKTDMENFDPRADKFLTELPPWGAAINAMIAELNKLISGLDQQEPIPAWEDAPTSYSFPQVVAGSDGYSYRCVDVGVVGVDPVTDGGVHWRRLGASSVPVGSIVPWLGGYFTNGSNGGFVNIVGDDAASINAEVSRDGFRLANGAEYFDASSPYYNAPGRCLANISDNRFLMGASISGTIGGANSMEHTHGIGHTHTMAHSHTIAHTHTTSTATLNSSQNGPHAHSTYASSHSQKCQYHPDGPEMVARDSVSTGSSGSGSAHGHGNTGGSSAGSSGGASTSTTSNGSTTTSSGASYTENRPSYLSCHWLQKVSR